MHFKNKKVSMKKVANLFIVDCSGSMSDRVDGPNSSRKIEIAQDNLTEALKDLSSSNSDDLMNQVTVYLFEGGNIIKEIDSIDFSGFEGINLKVGGGTNLYDCICIAIDNIPSGFDGGIIDILTDGEENTSKRFKLSDVQSRIKDLRDKKWMITFSGANEESLEEAKEMGISASSTVMFSNEKGMRRSGSLKKDLRGAYASNVITDTVTFDFLDAGLANVMAEDEDGLELGKCNN